MIDRFKHIFVICSLDYYDFLDEYKEEILKPYLGHRIVMPFLFGKDLEVQKGIIRDSVVREYKSNRNSLDFEDFSCSDYHVKEAIDEALLKQKLKYAIKKIKSSKICIYINPESHPTKDIYDLSASSSIEAMMELSEADKRDINFIIINTSEFVKNHTKQIKLV